MNCLKRCMPDESNLPGPTKLWKTKFIGVNTFSEVHDIMENIVPQIICLEIVDTGSKEMEILFLFLITLANGI